MTHVKRRRTLIVSIISVFQILFGGIGFLASLFGSIIQQGSESGGSQYGFFAFIAREFGERELRAAIAGCCLIFFITGVGLWKMLPWARAAMIALSIISICSLAERVLEFRLDQRPTKSLDFSDTLVALLLLAYFLRPKIKERFQRQSAAASVAIVN